MRRSFPNFKQPSLLKKKTKQKQKQKHTVIDAR
jgi:hypothetical protein